MGYASSAGFGPVFTEGKPCKTKKNFNRGAALAATLGKLISCFSKVLYRKKFATALISLRNFVLDRYRTYVRPLMNVDDFVKLIDSVAKLLGVLVWPTVAGFVLLRFGPALKEFFSSLGEFSFKGGGFEATAKRKQAEAAAALVAASVSHPDANSTPGSAAQRAGEAAAVVAGSVNAQVIRRASKATALWVDDHPDNNIYERQSLEALGLSFVLATSTDEALDLVAKQKFDVIISDMERPPDPRAGYTLLDQLRSSGNRTPLVFYAGSNALEHKAEARKHGAIGSTNRASELFGYVLTALNRDG